MHLSSLITSLHITLGITFALLIAKEAVGNGGYLYPVPRTPFNYPSHEYGTPIPTSNQRSYTSHFENEYDSEREFIDERPERFRPPPEDNDRQYVERERQRDRNEFTERQRPPSRTRERETIREEVERRRKQPREEIIERQREVFIEREERQRQPPNERPPPPPPPRRVEVQVEVERRRFEQNLNKRPPPRQNEERIERERFRQPDIVERERVPPPAIFERVRQPEIVERVRQQEERPGRNRNIIEEERGRGRPNQRVVQEEVVIEEQRRRRPNDVTIDFQSGGREPNRNNEERFVQEERIPGGRRELTREEVLNQGPSIARGDPKIQEGERLVSDRTLPGGRREIIKEEVIVVGGGGGAGGGRSSSSSSSSRSGGSSGGGGQSEFSAGDDVGEEIFIKTKNGETRRLSKQEVDEIIQRSKSQSRRTRESLDGEESLNSDLLLLPGGSFISASSHSFALENPYDEERSFNEKKPSNLQNVDVDDADESASDAVSVSSPIESSGNLDPANYLQALLSATPERLAILTKSSFISA